MDSIIRRSRRSPHTGQISKLHLVPPARTSQSRGHHLGNRGPTATRNKVHLDNHLQSLRGSGAKIQVIKKLRAVKNGPETKLRMQEERVRTRARRHLILIRLRRKPPLHHKVRHLKKSQNARNLTLMSRDSDKPNLRIGISCYRSREQLARVKLSVLIGLWQESTILTSGTIRMRARR